MKKKKKLDLIYISSHYLPDISGLEITMENIVKEQLLTNDNVQVVTSKHRKKRYPKQDHVKRLNRFEIFGTIFIIPKLLLYLLKTNKRIYYVHYAILTIPEIGFFVSKLKSQKFVIHIHLDLEGSTKFRKLFFKIYNHTIFRFILKRSDAIIVPTNSVKIYISKKYKINPKKIYYSIPAIEIERFSCLEKKSHNGFNILFVGNLKIQKNVPLLINAFDILASKNDDANLFIIGTGDQEKNIKLLASSKKNHERIHFLGAVPYKKVQDYYIESDVFVLPYLTETAGIVILEAFAARMAVVATKCLGVIDFLRKILIKI